MTTDVRFRPTLTLPAARCLFLRACLSLLVFTFTASQAIGDKITVAPIVQSGLINDTVTGYHVQSSTMAGQGEEITVSYTNTSNAASTANPGTLTGGGTTVGRLNFNIQAKPGSTITVTNLTEGTTATTTASATIFTPPTNTVVSAFTLGGGSSLSFGGDTFALTGGFTAIDTHVDYNPLSPTFGMEGGSIQDVAIGGSSGGNTVSLLLSTPPTYSLALAPLWASAIPGGIPDGGLSTPADLALSGTLLFDSVHIPFTGTFTGTVTFLNDGSTTEQGSLSLLTSFGTATGSLSGSAIPQLEPVPEPRDFGIVGLVCGLLLCCRPRSAGRRAF